MMSSAIRQYLAYLLIALLPLQAVAASRLAVCAELMEGPPQSAPTMEHCEQMADMPLPQSEPDTSISHPHQTPGCWLGSICLVGSVAFALPMKHQSTAMERETPLYLSAIGHYRSVILDSPQRPPTTL